MGRAERHIDPMSDQVDRIKAALAGQYEIEGEIGHGGMATVYLAHDIRHDRQVAVKVLRPDIAATLGAERFLREVRIAASLTHPHILGLHDSGEADGFLYYVMPFIDGESLRERVAREGELPVQDAVRIIKEVTDALACAHAHNVVHRDIKPDNILLAGRHAMVVDFGVAKAIHEATGRDKLTTAGVALGTPSYMSPEQAAADPHIDHRADIYAVGVVAYELLTGEPPFTGTTQQQILAAHLAEPPRPLGQRRSNLPPDLEQLVMRCLQKRASDRWQTAEEMLQVLEGLSTPSVGITPAGTAPIAGIARPKSPNRVAVVTGVVVAAAMIGFFGWSSFRTKGPIVEVTNTRQVTRGVGLEIDPSISPDGREVAYATWSGNQLGIQVRDIEGGRAIELARDSVSVYPSPRWSADGRTIVFCCSGGRANGSSLAVPRFGGPASPIVDNVVQDIRGDAIVYGWRDSLFTRAWSGGDERLVAVASVPYSAALSPNGERVAYVTGNDSYVMIGGLFGNVAPSTIWTVDTNSGEPVPLTSETALNTSPAWLPDGRHLLFISDRDGPRDLYLVRVSGSGEPAGPPVRITTGLEPHSVSLSADGTRAVYSRFIFRRNIWAVPLPETGTASIEDGRPVTEGNQVVESHGLSPDGTTLAFDADFEGNQDIYVVPADGGEPRRITTDPADEFNPDFSPDGSEIAFHSWKFESRDIFVMDAGGGNVQRVTDMPGQEYHAAFSPDGRQISFGYLTAEERGIYVVGRDSSNGGWGQPRRLSDAPLWYPRWSPDGLHLVAHSGNQFIVLVALDGAERTVVEAQTAGLRQISWSEFSQDGRLIYFNGRDSTGVQGLYSVPVEGGAPRLAARYTDPSKPVWPIVTLGNGVVYLSVAEHESDVFAMDLVIR